MRDPKEVFVSSYYFSAGLLAPGHMVPVDEWLAAYLSDRFQYGSWAEQLAGYWAWRDRPNVRLLSFAEMKVDLPGAVDAIASLMGVALTEAERAKVLAQSTFSHMKAIDHKFVPRKPSPFDRLLPTVMMRKGERGSSAELLSPEQQAQIDGICALNCNAGTRISPMMPSLPKRMPPLPTSQIAAPGSVRAYRVVEKRSRWAWLNIRCTSCWP